MALDLTKLGDDVDVETVLALASFLVSVAVPGAAPVLKTIETAAPVALRIYKMVKSDHFSPEELESLNKLMNEQSAEIQKPLEEPPT